MLEKLVIPLLCIVLMAGALVALSARVTRWTDLHWSYGRDLSDLPAGRAESHPWVGLRVRGWGLMVDVKLYTEGVWLAPKFPMSYRMAPVLIPFSAFHFIGPTWLGYGATVFLVDGCESAMYFSGWGSRKVEDSIRHRREQEIVDAARASLTRRPFRVPTVF